MSNLLINKSLQKDDYELGFDETDVKLYNSGLIKINNFITNKINASKYNQKQYEEQYEEQYENDKNNVENIKDFANYIIKDSIVMYDNNASIFCKFLWSGITFLDHWELQRKLDKHYAKKLMKIMINDYNTYGNFMFYDPIHLALKSDNKYYVIDGQHRLVAWNTLCIKNKYPIQQIPCVIWTVKFEDDFLTLFDRINSRTPIDRTKLFNYKILEIIQEMTNQMGKSEMIWGSKRPKIDKDLFVQEMRSNESIHKMETGKIMEKIKEINNKIRGLPRTKRANVYIGTSVHTHAETMDFFLGYDKELKWIYDIK